MDITVLAPSAFRTVPCPTYPEMRPAIARPNHVHISIVAVQTEHVHIVTEGPLASIARRWGMATGRLFTTSVHPKFPEYLRAKAPIQENWTYALLRRFYSARSGCIAVTSSLRRDLARRGVQILMLWS